MSSPVSAISYLARAMQLLGDGERAKLLYSALELRCGVEARLKEHAALAVGTSRAQLSHYEIKKLSRTVQEAFGLGDSFLFVFLQLEDGRVARFSYLPVTTQLQSIAARLGDYLHAVPHDRATSDQFWTELRSMLTEGCGLLKLACSSEILRPTFEHGLHFCLPENDPRAEILTDFINGVAGTFRTVTFTPVGPLTYYPANEA